MVALPLLDAVLSGPQPKRSAKVATELVRSSLGRLQQIENLDQSLAPADLSDFDRQTIALLRAMYQEWAQEADALLQRVLEFESSQQPIEGSRDLRDALGRTQAMLSIPLDRLEHSHKEAIAGRTVTAEEVRRELRLGVYRSSN